MDITSTTDRITLTPVFYNDDDLQRSVTLAQHLDVDLDAVEPLLTAVEHHYSSDGLDEWLVLQPCQADEWCAAYIEANLWTLSPNFLASYTELDAGHIEMIQTGLRERGNEVLRALVGDDMNPLTSDAMARYGRGHFLASYDGDEHEVGDFCLYRVN